MNEVAVAVISALVALAGMLLWLRSRGSVVPGAGGEDAERLVAEARRERDALIREGQIQLKDEQLAMRSELERETRERHREIEAREQALRDRERSFEVGASSLEIRVRETEARAAALATKEREVEAARAELGAAVEESRATLERLSGLSRDEARRTLLDQMLSEVRLEGSKRIRQVEEEARAEADRRAKRVVAVAIERLAGEFVAERTISVVHLPSDDMKGRIIGREGRNIRAIEAATGVDLIIDDTPESVVISCHNPIRREIARLALEKLLSDGRIHPGRIEEVVRKAEHDVEESIREAGQRALIEVGVHGVHPEIVKLLGMLRYRYSYAQNVLTHSIEAAFLCGTMAGELGLNVKQARRAALLHDIGKSLTHEVEGSHALIGAEIARKYGESAKICNAIAAHHEEVRAETLLAPLVDAADAISGARPGARREMLESYAKRLDDLEAISNSFPGVERSFAVQAGREIRILVEPGQINDDQAALLARDVARKIESDMTYPGQIRVTVIRETRASDLAR